MSKEREDYEQWLKKRTIKAMNSGELILKDKSETICISYNSEREEKRIYLNSGLLTCATFGCNVYEYKDDKFTFKQKDKVPELKLNDHPDFIPSMLEYEYIPSTYG